MICPDYKLEKAIEHPNKTKETNRNPMNTMKTLRRLRSLISNIPQHTNTIPKKLGLLLLLTISLFTASMRATSIAPGETKTGTIATVGQQDTYSFAANAGNTVT